MEGVGSVSADTLSVQIQLLAQLCLVCSLYDDSLSLQRTSGAGFN